MKASTILRNITFMSKNAEKSAQFFIDVFNLKIVHFSENYSELTDANNSKIVFIKTNSDPHTRTGYNPLLNFSVLDFDSIKERLENYDIEYDGEIKDNDLGKYACIKTPDGIMVCITEFKSPEIDNDDFSVDYNEDSKLDPNTAEIRNILEKIKI